MLEKPWRVIVHLRTAAKIEFRVGNAGDAREYAKYVVTEGVFTTDKRGVMTFFPTWQIHKVKVVPPDVVLGKTEQDSPFDG